MSAQIGYWFSAGDTLQHGDGRKIVVGETLRVKGPLKMCVNGLHWSEHPFDALSYAPGPWLHKVRAGGKTLRDGDKCCSRERTVLARVDATDMLRDYARGEALTVIHLWDAPEVVRRYLETGDENIRDAAGDAARAAAGDAAWAAAGAAARAAARAAAGAAARAARAARAAAGAARAAAGAAARERFRVAVEAAFGDAQ